MTVRRIATVAELEKARTTRPWLRLLRHQTSCGQSAAVRTGVIAARSALIVTLDGDGQNDPAFIPQMLAALDNPRVALVAGQRTGRKDGPYKKWQSRIANGVRGRILRDGTRDTGCGLKAFRRDVYLSLPYFDAFTASCRPSSSGKGSRSPMWTSSIGRVMRAGRITAFSIASGSEY